MLNTKEFGFTQADAKARFIESERNKNQSALDQLKQEFAHRTSVMVKKFSPSISQFLERSAVDPESLGNAAILFRDAKLSSATQAKIIAIGLGKDYRRPEGIGELFGQMNSRVGVSQLTTSHDELVKTAQLYLKAMKHPVVPIELVKPDQISMNEPANSSYGKFIAARIQTSADIYESAFALKVNPHFFALQDLAFAWAQGCLKTSAFKDLPEHMTNVISTDFAFRSMWHMAQEPMDKLGYPESNAFNYSSKLNTLGVATPGVTERMTKKSLLKSAQPEAYLPLVQVIP